MVFSTAAPEEKVQVGATPGGCPIRLNRRSVCMLKQAQQDGGFTLGLVQGSFNPGPKSTHPCNVEASAGTHDAGGVFDASVKGLTETQIDHRVRHPRLAGWAAWHRTTIGAPHIHAVAIGDTQLPQAAKNQVTAYKNGRNGLANNGPDPDARVDEKFLRCVPGPVRDHRATDFRGRVDPRLRVGALPEDPRAVHLSAVGEEHQAGAGSAEGTRPVSIPRRREMGPRNP
jgi:hypothetical protein